MSRHSLSQFVLASLLIACSSIAKAQPVRPNAPAIDSASARCMDIDWLDARARCEGRALNATAAAFLGASAGALTGFVGATLVSTSCIGSREDAAARGALTGAVLGGVTGVLVRHISRRAVAEQSAKRRAASGAAPKPWSWRDVRPTVAALGVIAVGGGIAGAVPTGRPSARCGVGAGAAQGALVYGIGGTATLTGSLLVVRVMF